LEGCLFQLSHVIADSTKSVSERAQLTNFFVRARQEKVCSICTENSESLFFFKCKNHLY